MNSDPNVRTGAQRARDARERRMADDLEGFRESERRRARERHRSTHVPKPPSRSCVHCAAAIHQGSFCSSPDCQRARNRLRARRYMHERRARMRGNEWESFEPVEVYVRDGWICGICSEPVDREASFPDLLSVSLDHILPVSLGGPHTRENTRCAHFGCNSKRGNRVA